MKEFTPVNVFASYIDINAPEGWHENLGYGILRKLDDNRFMLYVLDSLYEVVSNINVHTATEEFRLINVISNDVTINDWNDKAYKDYAAEPKDILFIN